MLEGNVNVTLVPPGQRDDTLTSIITARDATETATAPPPIRKG